MRSLDDPLGTQLTGPDLIAVEVQSAGVQADGVEPEVGRSRDGMVRREVDRGDQAEGHLAGELPVLGQVHHRGGVERRHEETSRPLLALQHIGDHCVRALSQRIHRIVDDRLDVDVDRDVPRQGGQDLGQAHDADGVELGRGLRRGAPHRADRIVPDPELAVATTVCVQLDPRRTRRTARRPPGTEPTVFLPVASPAAQSRSRDGRQPAAGVSKIMTGPWCPRHVRCE